MAAVMESLFYVGKKFVSYDELQSCKEIYETSNLTKLTMRDSKTLESMNKYAPKKAARANNELRYYSLRLCCSYGGKKFKRKGDGKREKESRKVGCGMFIRLVLSDDGQSLDVAEIIENHSNHRINAEDFLHQMQQRRSHPADLLDAETTISVRADSELVQQQLQNHSGKVIPFKDVVNVGYGSRQQSMPDNLTEVLKQLHSHGDCVVEVLANEDNIFLGLFYQDHYMQKVFELYPDMLFCDATYKLLDLQLSVFIMLAVDGSGQSEIVAVMLLADETRSTMSAAIKTFQDHNPEWTRTVSIMTDKDFVERTVFSDLFPNAVLLICLYHTLRTFQHEVTCEKMGITSSQRKQCLSILEDLAYSADEDAYNSNMDRLLAFGCEKVNDYVRESWEPIRDEWVEGLKAEHLTFGESSNNPLEGINAKIKSICSKDASLQQFFFDFRSFISSLHTERQYRALMICTKIPTTPVPDEMVPYLEFLTPFTFDFVMTQYNKSLSAQCTACIEETFIFISHGSTVSTTPTSCSCVTYCSKWLPCQHLLYVRRCLDLGFNEAVLDSRWSRFGYMKHCNSLQNEGESAAASVSHVDESVPVKGIRELSQAAKYRKTLNLADSIASLCCEAGMTIFQQRCEILQKLHDSWSKGEEVLLVRNVPEIGRALVKDEAPVDIRVCVALNEEEPADVEVEPDALVGVSKMDPFDKIEMSAAMRKRGRTEGRETEVIGLAKRRQREGIDSSESQATASMDMPST